MGDVNRNLWAPWRMAYIRSLDEEKQDVGCFLCHYWEHPKQDRENLVVWRSESAFVVMNRFPYTTGHLLVAHGGHKGDLSELTEPELAEMGRLHRDVLALLREAMKPEGFNVGYNLGHCAGAGLPGHLHGHVVPRWIGDTNYMTVVADTRVLPDSLEAQYDDLAERARQRGWRS